MSFTHPFITTRARDQAEKLGNMPAKRKCREGKATEASKSCKRKCSRRSVVRDEDLSDGEADSKQVLIEDIKAIIGYV